MVSTGQIWWPIRCVNGYVWSIGPDAISSDPVYSGHGQNRGEQVFGFGTQQKEIVGRFEALGCVRFGEMSPVFLPEGRDVENVGVQGRDALVFANTVTRFGVCYCPPVIHGGSRLNDRRADI